ncbi:DUF3352 domain-containing protein [Synechococcus sp. PCC 6717]|nr:DUF3352 domain-containing protein [Synechococcus sp. PCC 6717]
MQSRHRSNWFIVLLVSLCWFMLVCEPAQAAVVDDMVLVPRYALSALRFHKRPTVEPLRRLWDTALTPQLATWGWQWSDMATWAQDEGVLVQLPCATQCDAPRLLWIWHLKRPDAATAFLNQYWQDHAFDTQTYQGVPVQVGERVATATLGDRLLVATDPAAILASLGSRRAKDANLGGVAFYQEALAQFNDQDSLLFYANLHPLTRENQFAPAYDRLLVGVRSHNNEIHLEIALHATAAPAVASVPLPLDDLRTLGDRPTLVLAGRQLPTTYRDLLANLETFSVATTPKGTPIVPELLRDFTLGVDLEEIIFPLATDRYTLALWRQPAGWQWWWQTRQTPETPTLLKKLDEQARSAGYDVNRLVLDKQAVTAWVKLALAADTSEGLAAEVAAVYQQDNDTLTLASALPYLMPAKQRAPWLSDELTRQRRAIVGLAYAQWSDLYPYLAERVPLLAYLNGLTAGWLGRLQSITWVNYGASDRLQRSEIIVTTN